jgi:hypothetical protein
VSTNHPKVARRHYSITPRGAFVLAALLLCMILAGWMAFYFLLFLPRGTVG